MSKESVPISSLINYYDLDTVIKELEELRDQYGGKSIVHIYQEWIPYTDNDYEIVANLEIRKK